MCLCVHVPFAVANDFQHTTLTHAPTQMYIYQFSFWRGVNWSHIKYPMFYTNWAFGRTFFSRFVSFSTRKDRYILFCVLYKYWIRNVNRRCCCTNDKIVDIEIYSNLCTGHTNCGRDTIAQELLRVPMKMISLSLQTPHLKASEPYIFLNWNGRVAVAGSLSIRLKFKMFVDIYCLYICLWVFYIAVCLCVCVVKNGTLKFIY